MIFEDESPLQSRPVSEQLRQLRENNAKILGLSEDIEHDPNNNQLNTEDVNEDENM